MIKHLLLAGCMLLTACSVPEKPADDRLYRELGKLPGIELLVDEFLVDLAADLRIIQLFAMTDVERFREKLIELICLESGGPCTYTGDPMVVVHSGMDITEGEFNALVEDLEAAMIRLGIAQTTQNRLIARLARMRDDIIYR